MSVSRRWRHRTRVISTAVLAVVGGLPLHPGSARAAELMALDADLTLPGEFPDEADRTHTKRASEKPVASVLDVRAQNMWDGSGIRLPLTSSFGSVGSEASLGSPRGVFAPDLSDVRPVGSGLSIGARSLEKPLTSPVRLADLHVNEPRRLVLGPSRPDVPLPAPAPAAMPEPPTLDAMSARAPATQPTESGESVASSSSPRPWDPRVGVPTSEPSASSSSLFLTSVGVPRFHGSVMTCGFGTGLQTALDAVSLPPGITVQVYRDAPAEPSGTADAVPMAKASASGLSATPTLTDVADADAQSAASAVVPQEATDATADASDAGSVMLVTNFTGAGGGGGGGLASGGNVSTANGAGQWVSPPSDSIASSSFSSLSSGAFTIRAAPAVGRRSSSSTTVASSATPAVTLSAGFLATSTITTSTASPSLASSGAGTAQPAIVGSSYLVSDLHPTGSTLSSAASAINGGVIGGYQYDSSFNPHAKVWNGTTSASIASIDPSSGYTGADIHGMSGTQKVGSGVVSSVDHALLWTSNTTVVDLNPSISGASSIALATNGSQQAGYVTLSSGVSHAYLWSGSASGTDLHPSSYIESMANGIATSAGNTREVGYGKASTGSFKQAVYWSGSAGSIQNLSSTGFDDSEAWGIAASGSNGFQVVGEGTVGGSSHAALWNSLTGNAIDINPSGYATSVAFATNGSIQVGEGALPNDPNQVVHALLWTGTSNAIDLNQYLPNGFTSAIAYGIDANGLIVGKMWGSDFVEHAALWTPVPEPTAAVSILLLAGSLAPRRRRRRARQ